MAPADALPSVPPSVAQLHDLVAYAQTEVRPNLRADDDAERLLFVVGMFSRATTTLEAIVLLVEAGFGQQAWMLNRALLELMVDAHWAETDRDRSSERIVEYAQWDWHRRRKHQQEHPASHGALPAMEDLPRERLAELSARFACGSWTGRPFDKRVSDVTQGMRKREADQLTTLATLFNLMGNAEMHPSPYSLARVLRRVEREDGSYMFQLTVTREDYLSDGVVRAAWWAYMMFLELIVEVFDLDRDRLRALYDSGTAAFDDEDQDT